MTLTPLLVTLVAVCFWIYCLVDFPRTDERDVRVFTRPVWLVILVRRTERLEVGDTVSVQLAVEV